MTRKQAKSFNKTLAQKTLAETWFPRKEPDTKESEDESNENIVDDQTASDDSDFVASSQDTTESKLKRKVNQTLLKRSTGLSNSSPEKVNKSANQKTKSYVTPDKTPNFLLKKQKTPNSTPKKYKTVSPNVSDKQLSISDVCEVNSIVIKQEIDEMLQDVNNFESFEMMHDLSGILASDKILSGRLECTPTIVTCEAEAENTDEGEEQEEQDPLYIEEKEKNKVLKKKEKRKRSKSIDEKEEKEEKEEKNTSDNEEEFSEEMLRSLNELHIKLCHIVPPQHKIENCAGSRPLKEKQISLFETYGPLKRGPFTTIEDEIIKNNWTCFCKLHNWNEKWVEPFLSMRHEGKYYISKLEERKNFVRFLSNGLPWRSLYSVYSRFKNIYNNSVQYGPYTKSEDQKIIEHISKATPCKLNKKCAELAITLNRKRHSIWQRYQKLKVNYNIKTEFLKNSHDSDLESDEEKKSKNKKKHQLKRSKIKPIVFKRVYEEVKWTYPLASRLIEKLMEIMSCENLEELKNQTIDDEIWKKLESKMSIDRTVLQNFWNLTLYMQLFYPKSLYMNDFKMDLIKYLHENKISSSKLEWDEIQLDFNGVTPAFLSKVFDHLVKHVQEKLDTTDINITEIIEYLYNTHLPELDEKNMDHVLHKILFKNGRITGISKSSERRLSKGTTDHPLSDEEF